MAPRTSNSLPHYAGFGWTVVHKLFRRRLTVAMFIALCALGLASLADKWIAPDSSINQELADTPDPAQRILLERARTIGLAAYEGRELPIPGGGEDG